MHIAVEYEDGTRRAIGIVNGGVLIRIVSLKKHLFRNLDAWGLDYGAYNVVVKRFERPTALYEEDSKMWYYCKPDVYAEHGVCMDYSPHGVQIFVPRKHWTPYALSPVPVTMESIREMYKETYPIQLVFSLYARAT